MYKRGYRVALLATPLVNSHTAEGSDIFSVYRDVRLDIQHQLEEMFVNMPPTGKCFYYYVRLKEKMLPICDRETAQGVYLNCTIWYYVELIKELFRNASWALFLCTLILKAASLTVRLFQNRVAATTK